MEFLSVNPADEAVLDHWSITSARQRDELLDTAAAAQREWRLRSIAERAHLLRGVAAVLRQSGERLARLATAEMGKPLVESRAEVDKCASACAFFADHSEAMLADEPTPSNASESYVSYLPLGVIFAIMPWNFPYWQVFRHVAPAVMAGNCVLVKHAENTLGCAHAIVRAFRDAGAPDGLVSTVVATNDDALRMIGDRRVAAVTLTGSNRAGAAVAATAGAAGKKTVLELGGSDAFVVLADADVAAAAAVAVRARFQNAGQSCIAAKRFIVVAAVAAEFTESFIEHTRALVVGDPTQEATQLGPMARSDLRTALVGQLDKSVAGGAQVLLAGGARGGLGDSDARGFWFDPVVLAVHDLSAPVWREEVFGPVAPITVVADEERALAVANDCDFGLGGAVWTADVARGKAFARRLESGAAFVNGMTASDPRLPFGGVKRSGYGRELSAIGMREFTNVQTVWVGPAVS